MIPALPQKMNVSASDTNANDFRTDKSGSNNNNTTVKNFYNLGGNKGLDLNSIAKNNNSFALNLFGRNKSKSDGLKVDLKTGVIVGISLIVSAALVVYVSKNKRAA